MTEPSRSDSTIHAGLGFFFSITTTSAVGFFNLWLLVGTVVFPGLVVLIVESSCMFIVVSQSINNLRGLQ